MGRLVYAILLGLVGAAIVHIAILLLVPTLSENDAWARMSAVTKPFVFGPPPAAATDPLFLSAVCRFDLSEAPVRISTSGPAAFWSASIYDRRGENLFSLTDRTASQGRLDLVILTPAQFLAVRNDMPEEMQAAVFIEMDGPQGMAAVRVFVPDESWRPTAERWLSGASCAPRR